MSDYRHEKVLRIPVDDAYEIETKFKNLFKYCEVGYFSVAPTEESFIDFVLNEDYGMTAGDWGRVRFLTAEEQIVWSPIFKKIIPNINMNDVHLVEFCWYNCSEAPDYYSMEEGADTFYKFIGGPEKYSKLNS